MSAAIERRRVLYSGQVQGVGFRWTTERIAGGLAVTGFVRNLPDGRVELVAEGTSAALDQLLQQVAEAMQHNIRQAVVESLAASGEFARFQIRN